MVVIMVEQPFCAHEKLFTSVVHGLGWMMLLSVYMPHSGSDEEGYIEALEKVRATLTEGKKEGAVAFFVGGDFNIEFRLDNGNEDLQGMDSIDWYWMYGPECRGSGVDAITCKKRRWLQL